MDPFIEACGLWGDFHSHLIEAIFQVLSDAVPERYFVRTEERHGIELIGADEKKLYSFRPDVGVTSSVEPGSTRKNGRKSQSSVAVAEEEAIAVRAFIEETFRESFVEIYESDPKTRLVTTIEVLSPSNKRAGERRDEYLRKRQAAMLGGVNLVEIDLLRGGQRMPMLDPWPDSPYVIMVSRGKGGQSCRVWRGYPLRPLPAIPVPLAKPDPDIAMHLQPMIDAIYERSRYSRSIDYAKPIKPPLSAEESAWLKKQLRSRAAK